MCLPLVVDTWQLFSLAIIAAQFFPVNWLKLHKGCRPKPGEKADCPQAIGFQVKAGTIIGDVPPYEAFCMGGSNSIRGWYNCDLAVARTIRETLTNKTDPPDVIGPRTASGTMRELAMVAEIHAGEYGLVGYLGMETLLSFLLIERAFGVFACTDMWVRA